MKMRSILCIALLLLPGVIWAEETFLTIQSIRGNQITVVKDASRRAAGAAANQSTVLTVPADAKITTAMRERRTFEFRVGGELAGGLQHDIFKEMKAPLSARIVTEGNRITEINVITPQIDINQSQTDASGKTVIAIRPKRPPMKKK
jgi:hypothetical protein